jgi:4-hydroxy-tetrahydrodipicolinate synthase
MKWQGVVPAVTTPFRTDLSVDFDFLRKHVEWLVANGCTGIVALGSLGEGQTLRFDEKVAILRACREALSTRAPLVAGVAALSTTEAVALARAAADAGCDGLMVLPPYVYKGDWRETEAYFRTVIAATSLSCMLYNNPVAYGTDVMPDQAAALASALPNLHAVKESSTDVRRITAIRALLGSRLAIFAGVDDLIVEAIAAGAVGWIAGLVNALPVESVRLFDGSLSGRHDEARRLYEWFLPLLRLDTVPKFVHLIKLVQEEVGMGSARVRPPRLELVGAELDAARALIRERLKCRPRL